MPLLHFSCPVCKLETRALVSAASTKTVRQCVKCKVPLLRAPKPATSRVTEVLDNGLMSRRIERPADAERLYKERAVADNERIENPKL
jgi:hypothetical protein